MTLRDALYDQALQWLNRLDRNRGDSSFLPHFIRAIAFELTATGDDTRAETLLPIIYQKFSVEYWGEEQAHRMHCDQMNDIRHEIVRGCVYRGDYNRARDVLAAMSRFSTKAAFAAMQLAASKGDHDHAMSFTGVTQFFKFHEESAGSRGALVVVDTLMSVGEPVLELGRLLLKQNAPWKTIEFLFTTAAEMGLDNLDLTSLASVLALRPETGHRLVIKILEATYQKNQSIYPYEQHRVILRTLRRWFPILREMDIVNSPSLALAAA